MYFDPVRRRTYGSDAGWFEVDPLGVVVPIDADDVSALARYAHDQRLRLHPRGGGTTSSGESLGEGLVVDLSRHFRQVSRREDGSIDAHCGVTADQIRDLLTPIGRRVALDAQSVPTRTVGGLIGTNAATAHGSMADLLERVTVVLSNGERAEFGTERADEDGGLLDESAMGRTIVRRMTALSSWHGPLIRDLSSRSRRLGYDLSSLEAKGGLRIMRLFAGAHGTLGLVTRATLRTEPIPECRRTLALPFRRLTDAMGAVREAVAWRPASLGLFDWRAVRLAREASSRWRDWLSDATEAVLIAGFEADDLDELEAIARGLSRRLRRTGILAGEVVDRSREPDVDELLGLGRLSDPLLMRARGRARPMPLFRELYVPPEHLGPAVSQFQSIFQKYEVDWTVRGRVDLGLLELRALIDPADPAERAKLSSLATDLFEAATERGGGTTGEDARPFIPGPLHRRQLGELAPIVREIKSIFDPSELVNPGKTGADQSSLAERPFRRFTPRASLEVLEPSMAWPHRPAIEEAIACNGCGECRTREGSVRMCPAFRSHGTEPSSPRGKANLFRLLASGEIAPGGVPSEELQAVADLCLNCRTCRSECPSGVDIPGLVLEMKAANHRERGSSPPDWVISRLDVWGQIACLVPHLFNATIGQGGTRWLIERVFGLSRHRRWPRVQRTSFLRRAERLGLTTSRPTEPGPRVAYFVDTFANYFDQATASAVVGVLRHCGVNVFVPKKQQGSGMSALQVGDVDRAREIARANLRVLGDAVREGYTVVCSEPTAALMLRDDYTRLVEDIDAGLVASNTMDLSAYLVGLAERGLLPAPHQPLPARAGYHQPCHQRVQGIGTPSLELLRKVPGLDVEHIDRGCSGMGVIHGLYRDNFRASVRAGRPLARRLREPDLDLGATDCGSCRLQMEQGSPKRTLHPIKLLAMGYGLLPELRARYRLPKGKNEIT